MAAIRINYSQTIAKAKQIKALANDIKSMVKKMDAAKSDINSYWQGEASTQYISEYEKLTEYMEKTSLRMEDLANAIIRIANLIKEADEAVTRAASSLES